MDDLSQNAAKLIFKEHEIFKGLSDEDLDKVISFTEEKEFPADTVILEEGKTSEYLYIIKNGLVEVLKDDLESQESYHLANLDGHAVFGELSLIDNRPHSATIRTIFPTTLFAIPTNELVGEESDNKFFLQSISKLKNMITDKHARQTFLKANLAKKVSQRVRDTNVATIDAMKKELENAKQRAVMGRIFINVIAMITAFTIILQLGGFKLFQAGYGQLTNIILIIMFYLGLFLSIKKFGYPLSTYGITLTNWKRALKEAIMMSVFLIVVLTFIKLVGIYTTPLYQDQELFSGDYFTSSYTPSVLWIGMLTYLTLVPLQELITRGFLQGAFERFFIGDSKKFWSIMLSNMIFIVPNLLMFSIHGAFFIFWLGVAWGWLYSKHKTLVGTVTSHWIVGVFGFYFLGFL